ncbi:sporulation protein YpeB [Ruminiclostridium hungatei]|uniref:Sporulation protein YpeB n=1 Tax=Ruminiclostridium hungatei TaxID=48256 RepID=A0A1V4SRD0_RUMHU|nr:germination protein YpeB [Ruminiclostridium hungatei]OPX45777.1 sporulation protein YpeB [Ruminiclostridium hungatei]
MEQGEYENMNYHNDGWKKRRRMSWALPIAIVAVLALAGVSTWGYFQNRQLMDLRIMMENQYSRAFLDLNEYVDNLEVLLAKSMVTSTTRGTSTMLEEVWRQANLAQTNMGQLPVTPPILEKTSNFLTQVGDMAYAYNTKTMNGMPLSDDEYGILQKMHGYALSLQNSLHGIEEQINNGKMSWGTAGGPRQLKSQNSKYIQTTQFENVDKNFQEYPSMIYDGPYSDHMLKVKPVGLKDTKVEVGKAEEIVRKLIGNDKIASVERLENNNEGSIKTFRFKVKYKNSDDNGSAEVDITQQGGQLYWMLRDRSVQDAKLSMEAAKKAAQSFLKKNGFASMKDTYYMRIDGIATICYAYEQEGAIVYPDLVKVKVALDNGEVLGVESKGYLYNHKVRNIPATKLTLEQARKQINGRLKIEKQGKAIIPTDFKTERYCYEFQGTVGDQKFLLYINALTGAEEDILMLVSTDEGSLTM